MCQFGVPLASLGRHGSQRCRAFFRSTTQIETLIRFHASHSPGTTTFTGGTLHPNGKAMVNVEAGNSSLHGTGALHRSDFGIESAYR